MNPKWRKTEKELLSCLFHLDYKEWKAQSCDTLNYYICKYWIVSKQAITPKCACWNMNGSNLEGFAWLKTCPADTTMFASHWGNQHLTLINLLKMQPQRPAGSPSLFGVLFINPMQCHINKYLFSMYFWYSCAILQGFRSIFLENYMQKKSAKHLLHKEYIFQKKEFCLM